MSGTSRWWSQLGTLIRKNALVSLRNWRSTAAQILAPAALCLLLLVLQFVADTIIASVDDPNPAAIGINTVPKCTGTPCDTIIYTPKGVEWVDRVMARVAKGSGLEFGKDIWSIGNDSRSIFQDNKTLCQYIYDNQNRTQNALMFTSAYLGNSSGPIPQTDIGYLLFYNYTWAKSHKYMTPGFNVMRAVDEAILQEQSGNETAKIEAHISKFPEVPWRVVGIDVVASAGAVWFYVAPMIIFFSLLTDIVTEKESRLRLGARMMGTSQSAYWISWFIHGLSFELLSMVILVCTGSALNFAVFRNVNWAVQPILFGIFGLSVVAMAIMASTLVQRASTAQAVGYAVILVGFVFQAILSAGYGMFITMLYNPGEHQWVTVLRWIFQFYPPFNLAKVYTSISVRSASTVSVSQGRVVKGPGFFWSDLWKNVVSFKVEDKEYISPAPGMALMWMLVSTTIFLILSWYFDNVIPGDHGSQRPLYFFLTREYWGIKPRQQKYSSVDLGDDESEMETADYDDDVATERKEARSPSQGNAISIQKMVKVYTTVCSKSNVRAVDNVSMTVRTGEVFCLLGHNGAGKTTLISVLTGLFLPTSGGCKVLGKDLITDLDDIRKDMGVCPQHNVLWEELTAGEHLHFFAKMKGIAPGDLEKEVVSRLTQVGLERVRNDRVSTFSGGMKRRLSVAISAIGNPKILFLDEPSTGMDPVNRAKMWHLIQEMKQGRSVILTTHSMEEAEILGDRIAIMARGKLRCIGTALHLKSRYGSGYHVSSVSHGSGHSNEVIKRVRSVAPEAVLKESDAGSLLFTVPREARARLPEILRSLQSAATEDIIQEWGVAHSSLEEVFLSVTHKYDPPYRAEEVSAEEIQESDSKAVSQSSEDLARAYAKAEEERLKNSRPWRALFLKTATLQMRQKGTNLCQIISPVVMLLVMLVLKLALKSILGDAATQSVYVPAIPIPLNIPYDLISFSTLTQSNLANLETIAYSSSDGDHPWWEETTSTCYKWFAYDGVQNAEMLNGHFPMDMCNLTNGTTVYIPFIERHDGVTKFAYETLLKFNDLSMADVMRPPLLFALPDATLSFKKLDPGTMEMSFSAAVNDNPTFFYHRANNFTAVDSRNISGSSLATDMSSLTPITQARLGIISFIDDAFARLALNRSLPTSTIERIASAKFISALPHWEIADTLLAIDSAGEILYPLALCLQLPLYAFFIVMEREEGLRNLMRAHGLRNIHYMVTSYFFDLALYAVAVFFLWITGAYLVELRLFTQTNPLTLIVVLTGWGLSLVSSGMLVAGLVSSRRAATIVGYAVALVGTLLSVVVAVVIYGEQGLSSTHYMPMAINIWPQFALVRAVDRMNTRCSLEYHCYDAPWKLNPKDEFVGVIAFLYADAVWIMLLALLLDSGRARNDLLFWAKPIRRQVAHLWRKLRKAGSGYEQIEADSDSSVDIKELSVQQTDMNDPDVLAEEQATINGEYDSQPLAVRNLRKRYPDATRDSVVGVTFGVRHGECFGLLGENGAGKTTTVSMLTGALRPTSGTASVAGRDVVEEAGEARLAVGVCPQFSVLWDDLTPMEHVLFFARLKGAADPARHARECLTAFGLSGPLADRPARALSGGMRRRLSVAIALAGGSSIAFLDEPSTGLDPHSRRQLWRVIRAARTGRAVVLTTHSMEEAETLCGRIGVMARGTLRCIGSPVHLKNRHAGGYSLLASFAPQDGARARAAVAAAFPEAEEVAMSAGSGGYSGFAEWRVRLAPAEVPRAFEGMDQRAEAAGIVDWSFAQLGLGEVFQSIVRESYAASPAVVSVSPASTNV